MIRKTAALMLALLLLFTTALADGICVRVQATDSEILSKGALRALSQWLEDAQLVFSFKENVSQVALLHGERTLLQALRADNQAVLTSGEYTAETEAANFDIAGAFRDAKTAAQRLGELLAEHEKSAAATAELGGVVKAKTQLSYALSAEAWQAIWPEVCAVLGEELAAYTIESKGTFRRYFASDGSEIGAYFYAEKVRFAADDVRTVRLEYGCSAEKGLYLAFRCPNAAETRNLRITVTIKRSVREGKVTHTISCDVRRKADSAQDTVLVEGSVKEEKGRLSGKTTLNYTRKRGSESVKHTLALKADLAASPVEGIVEFGYDRAGKTVLDGEMMLGVLPETEMMQMPAVNASQKQLTPALSLSLLETLENIRQEDVFELLYYLDRPSYLEGEETALRIEDDPRFIVTEVPE